MVDLDSGREQVGVTQGRPELNFAGTSAGTQLWKSSKPLQFQLIRFGGEGRNRAVHVRFCKENIRIFANKCKHFCTTLDLSERTHYLPPY